MDKIKKITKMKLFLPIFSMILVMMINVIYDIASGNPPLSFAGEPKTVEISGDLDTFTQTIWEALNPDNKISLFTRFVDLASGDTETRILNKYTR